jgi:hypothetical protein
MKTWVARLQVTEPLTVATPVFGVRLLQRSVWRPMSSGVRTVTVKLAVASLPELSMALHVTVVAPSGKVLSDGGSHVRSGSGSILSVAETA